MLAPSPPRGEARGGLRAGWGSCALPCPAGRLWARLALRPCGHHGNQEALQTQGLSQPLACSQAVPGWWSASVLSSSVGLRPRCPCRWVGASPGTTPRTALGTEDLILYGSPTTQVGMINPVLQMSKRRLPCFLRGKVAKPGSRPGQLASSQSPLRGSACQPCLSLLPKPQPRAAAPPIPATPPALQTRV